VSDAFTIAATAIPAVKLIESKRFGDDRGFFSETYSRAAFLGAGIDLEFVQDNHSFSERVGTLRGLHFQSPPIAQDKLIRCPRGRILDVAVDIRRGSPTYGAHVAVELSQMNWRQLLVPKGFAHGFITLEPSSEVLYKVTAPYSTAHDCGLAFDDPALGIVWPAPSWGPVLSAKDRRHPLLAELPAYFDFAECR
jgi:dTDP-4-dehydrorhamnose 3,5-epimerase